MEFQVTFLKTVLDSTGHVYSAPQAVMRVAEANSDAALLLAKLVFAKEHRLPWTYYADNVTVATCGTKPPEKVIASHKLL